MRIMADLHIHTTASDGMDEPRAVIAQCQAHRLSLCSVTDHDTFDGQKEAAAAAADLGVPYITGIELSVQHTGELHILGYGCDPRSTPWRAAMEELRSYRIGRTEEIIRRLQEAGLAITLEDVQREASGRTLGRPHVAKAIVKKGYAPSYTDAFEKYLNEGGLCYVGRRRLTAQQAIDLIHSAGGTAVVAHPGLITSPDRTALLRRLAGKGVEGLEAYYPAHSDGQVQEFVALARDLGLLVTRGSDYHGPFRSGQIGGEARGGARLAESIEMLKERHLAEGHRQDRP